MQFRRAGSLRAVMVKAMDYWIEVSEFELQSYSYIHFKANTLGKDMTPPYILSSMGSIVPLVPFEKDGFGIK